MKVIFITLFTLIFFNGISQDLELVDDKMNAYKEPESKNYSWLKKNFFLDLKLNLPTEVFKPKEMDIIFDSQPHYFTNFEYKTVEHTDRNFLINIIGVGIEPRVNLYETDKTSFGLKASFHFNLSVYNTLDNQFKERGNHHISSSAMVFMGRGLGSTYFNINEYGWALSAGINYIKTPISGGEIKFTPDEYLINPESEEFRKSTWLLPMIQFDHYRLTEKNRLRSVSFAAGYFNQSTYLRLNIGWTL